MIQFFTAVEKGIPVFRDVMLRPWINGSRRLEGTCPLLLAQGLRGKMVGDNVLLTHYKALSTVSEMSTVTAFECICNRVSVFERGIHWPF
jgi:hypothetical protein